MGYSAEDTSRPDRIVDMIDVLNNRVNSMEDKVTGMNTLLI